MADESANPPLQRRVPGAARAGPAPSARRVLPDALMARMQAAVDAAREAQGAAREAPDAEPVTEPLPRLQVAVAAQDCPPAKALTIELARSRSGGAVSRDDLAESSPAESERAAGDADAEPGTEAMQDRTPWWDWEHDATAGADPAPSLSPAATTMPATPVPLESRTSRRRRPAMAGVVALTTVLIAGGVAAFVLSSRNNAAQSSESKAPTNQRGTPLAREIASAATWVAAQVSRTGVVACDPAMCKALGQHGFPARQLLRLAPNAPYPLKSTIVVVTPLLLHQFGTSLADNWAPAVLADFGRGADQVTIRVMAPQGVLAYESALRTDRKQRTAVGIGLLTSRQITTTSAARSAMTDGDVDARLLIIVTALASQHPIDILAFGGMWPGTTVGIPLRTADFAENVPAAHMSEAAYSKAMIALLRAQPVAYRPVHIATIRFAGRNALQIEFPAPSPLGLVSPEQ